MWSVVYVVAYLPAVIQLPSVYVAALTPVTRNAAYAIGSSVTFSCIADRPNTMRWNYRTTPTHSALHTVHDGLRLTDDYNAKSRFSVVYRQLGSKLVISNVQLSDSGTYSCVDITGEQQFELIVLGSNAVCVTGLTQKSSLSTRSSGPQWLALVECSILYSGNCEPLIQCDQPFTHVFKSHFNQPTATFDIVHFVQRLEDNVLLCATLFPANCRNNVGPPSYRHEWNYTISHNASKAELTAATGNVAAVVGSNITLRCDTNSQSPMQWQRIAGSLTPDIIYNGQRLADRYANRCSVLTEMPQGHSTLTIREVNTSDGGTYMCVDLTGNQTFQLIVLASETVCSIDPSTSEQLTDLQQLTVTCNLNYNGNCSPVVDCAPHVDGEQVSFRDDNGSVVYLKRFAISRDFDGKIIACTTNFTTNCSNTKKDGFPSFKHIWESDPLHFDETSSDTSHSYTVLYISSVLLLIATACVVSVGCRLKFKDNCRASSFCNRSQQVKHECEIGYVTPSQLLCNPAMAEVPESLVDGPTDDYAAIPDTVVYESAQSFALQLR